MNYTRIITILGFLFIIWGVWCLPNTDALGNNLFGIKPIITGFILLFGGFLISK